jgi:hypothetical protein
MAWALIWSEASLPLHTCPYSNQAKNVHEGPIGIGTRIQYSEVALSAGNVISDGEPSLTLQRPLQ